MSRESYRDRARARRDLLFVAAATGVAVAFVWVVGVVQRVDSAFLTVLIAVIAVAAFALLRWRDAGRVARTSAQSEGVAREVNALLEAVIGSSPLAIVVLDRDLRVSRWNRAAEVMFGWTQEEVVGRKYPLVPGEVSEEFRREMRRRVFAGECITGMETVRECRDGSLVHVSISTAPLYGHSGGAMGAVAIMSDVTESKRAEQALRESEERYRRLMEICPEPVVVHDGERVHLVNEAMSSLLGARSPAELTGRPVLDFVHPDHRELVSKRMREMAVDGGSVPAAEMKLLRLDGEVVAVESAAAAIEQNGEKVILAIVKDVTEKSRAYEALQRSEEQLRMVVDTASDIISIMSPQGILRYNSPSIEAILGYAPDELEGVNAFELIHPEDASEVVRRLSSVLSGQETDNAEFRIRRKDGTWCYLESTGQVHWENGQIDGLIIVSRDVTDRKEMERAVVASERRYRALIEHSSDMVALLDADGIIRYASPSTNRLLGYDMAAFVGQAAMKLVHPDDHCVADAMFGSAVGASQEDSAAQMRVRNAAGDWRWVEAHANNMLDDPDVSAIVVNYRDVTERRLGEEALRSSEERARTIIESTSDIITILASDGTIIYNSPAIERVLGWKAEEVQGKLIFPFIHQDDIQQVGERFAAVVKEPDSVETVEFRFRTKDGQWCHLEAGGASIIDSDGELRVIVTSRDVGERKRAQETIRHMAYHDSLTGLPNRAFLKERLEAVLMEAAQEQCMSAVLYLDLDRFKVVNDTVGHAGGDDLLREVALELQEMIRDGDLVARVGGDEFTLLMTGFGHPEDATALAERIIAMFEHPRVIAGHEFHVTASIGITLFPNDGADAETLLRNADTAMYRAKDGGRNAYSFYAGFMKAELLRRVALEADLRHAIERGELEVYYQPIAGIRDGRIHALEALVRWQHPERGLVLPGEFISVVEETGLIIPMGEWVLETACGQAKEWLGEGAALERLAVNLSARQFHQPGIVDSIQRVLKETGLGPERLELEITEGTAMRDPDSSVAVLEALKSMGIRISIDDFGTGYSSLNYLKHFPIDTIKIDRSFIRDLTTDPNDAAITRAIIAMAQSLDLNVIAEGVETEAQLRMLSEYGCAEWQGYLLSQPAPADSVRRLLKAAVGQGGLAQSTRTG